MQEQFSRMAPLLGEAALDILKRAHVAVFGVGGVGGFCAEALARAGVGSLTFVDADCVEESNINRQIIALHSTIGQNKALLCARRAADINPHCSVRALQIFYDEDSDLELSGFDYIADAIDSVPSKTVLIERAYAAGVPIISAMGAGNRLRAHFETADIYSAHACPLARTMRRLLRERSIDRLKVVYSPQRPSQTSALVASVPFVPPVAGLLMAQEIVLDLVNL